MIKYKPTVWNFKGPSKTILFGIPDFVLAIPFIKFVTRSCMFFYKKYDVFDLAKGHGGKLKNPPR